MGGERAFFYSKDNLNNEVLLDLGSGGRGTTRAFDINEAGVIVGEESNGLAFQYFGSNYHDISFGLNSAANSVNSGGTIVGRGMPYQSSARYAALYNNGSIFNLNNLTDPTGAGWNLEEATSISDNGYITGYGTLNGQTRAFLLTPISRKTISGLLILQNTSSGGISGTETISWWLTGFASQYSGSVSVNQLGGATYSIEIPTQAPNGAYTLRFKGGTFLSSAYNVILNGNNLTRTVTLRNGDIDQDGEVGPGDFEQVVAQFGGTGLADCDNDGEVGPSDFEIVVGNFGLQDQ